MKLIEACGSFGIKFDLEKLSAANWKEAGSLTQKIKNRGAYLLLSFMFHEILV